MNILLIHGVDTNEETNPYGPWITAITNGLQSANCPEHTNTSGFDYNDIFDQYSSSPQIYAQAAVELIASAAWHSILPSTAMAAVPEQPGAGFLSEIRWSAGMVAQWVCESALRAACRDRLFTTIKSFNPDVIFAHSLGTLICYDLFANDDQHKGAFADGTIVTFGSQIGNTFIKDRMWQGQVDMMAVKRWVNLYNPYDPVFVASLDISAQSFYQFVPVFGSPLFDISAHQATTGNGHVGYLDNATTAKYLWPLLAGGKMAALIDRNMQIMKRMPRDLIAAVAAAKSQAQGLATSVALSTSKAGVRQGVFGQESQGGQSGALATSIFAKNAAEVCGQQWAYFGNQAYDINGHATVTGHKEGEDPWYKRVGLYWQDGADITGIDGRNHDWPWSAAFVSWVMRTAGAGSRFKYNAQHSVYVAQAIVDKLHNNTAAGYWAVRLNEERPAVGDIVCWARQAGISYDNTHGGDYEGHCDIVVEVQPTQILVVGGNVGDSVTKRPLRLENGFVAGAEYGGEYLFALMKNRIP